MDEVIIVEYDPLWPVLFEERLRQFSLKNDHMH